MYKYITCAHVQEHLKHGSNSDPITRIFLSETQLVPNIALKQVSVAFICVAVYIHIYMYMYIYIHTYIHTYIRTYTVCLCVTLFISETPHFITLYTSAHNRSSYTSKQKRHPRRHRVPATPCGFSATVIFADSHINAIFLCVPCT